MECKDAGYAHSKQHAHNISIKNKTQKTKSQQAHNQKKADLNIQITKEQKLGRVFNIFV